VHRTHGSSDALYYRVGHLTNPAGGDYTIQWDSGAWGIEYEIGRSPSIAINNHSQVVEVHQLPGETLLHHRRGTVTGGTIKFAESRRYDNYAEKPSVALLDNGTVLEVHSLGGLISRTGSLSLSNSTDIEWNNPIKLDGDNTIEDARIATNGDFAVQTHSRVLSKVLSICSSFARVRFQDGNVNGRLVMDYSGKVYVVLNDYRYHIPNPETFDALGYQWEKIVPLSYEDEIAIPERTPFPSVVPVSGPLNHPNGTLVKGLTSKVYVVLNDCRHWIPDQDTFNAMGYNWDKILSLGAVAEAMPEGMHFPSVAR
jgi:hypothetical protein